MLYDTENRDKPRHDGPLGPSAFTLNFRISCKFLEPHISFIIKYRRMLLGTTELRLS